MTKRKPPVRDTLPDTRPAMVAAYDVLARVGKGLVNVVLATAPGPFDIRLQFLKLPRVDDPVEATNPDWSEYETSQDPRPRPADVGAATPSAASEDTSSAENTNSVPTDASHVTSVGGSPSPSSDAPEGRYYRRH